MGRFRGLSVRTLGWDCENSRLCLSLLSRRFLFLLNPFFPCLLFPLDATRAYIKSVLYVREACIEVYLVACLWVVEK
jgi:hypothetical protein